MGSYDTWFSLTGLFYLAQCSPGSSVLCQMERFFFLQPSSVPLCKCTQAFYPISIDGHLGCFQILATANNSAINLGVHVLFQISVFCFFQKDSQK